ncbi:MAG: hypothetical protein CMJ51_02465 [Planctomycetaceae bacterium]|nr:hypothetical protein [Planctomycetaceae bacterium]
MSGRKGIGWTIWALIPVLVLAFHFGPGQDLERRDLAVRRHRDAIALELQATGIQAEAHASHLAVIEARRRALLAGVPGGSPEIETALERERLAYERAETAWEQVADAYGDVSDLLPEDADEIPRVRWSKARAQVRSGEIWAGAGELEALLQELDATQVGQGPLIRATREELAGARYYGARLMRLAGEPAKEWRAESMRARQQYRLLAEQAASDGSAVEVVRGYEDNVERVIDLEQMDRSEIEGRPLPSESPRGVRGGRPGNQGRPGVGRPGNRPDSRGAGTGRPIGDGW